LNTRKEYLYGTEIMGSLSRLGFEDYQSYLSSDWWKSLTNRLIIQNLKSRCFICGRKYPKSLLVLHHVSYDRLGYERLIRDVFVLCHDHHENAHFAGFFHSRLNLDEMTLRRRVYFLMYTYRIRNFLFGSLLRFIIS
jgi:hypothetical protein